MRIATYNVEWFDYLFDAAGDLRLDGSWSSRWDVTKAQQSAAVASVFKALDADILMVIEAPDASRHRDTVYALEGFAAHYGLRQRAAAIGFANHTQQEIAVMYDPNVVSIEHRPTSSEAVPAFTETYNGAEWSKPPFEAWVTPKSGDPFMLIGVHAKSKAPHGATTDAEAAQISLANRRKQLAQCAWLRERVDDLLAQNIPTIVLGDFNDGPGQDQFEEQLGKSGVEVVLGAGDTALYDPHAVTALCNRFACPTTARFYLHLEKRYLQALLDYVMVSSTIAAQHPSWRIWHPFDDPEIYANDDLRQALLTASDHFPVSIDLPD